MKCPICEGLNKDSARFCRHCGSPIHDVSAHSTRLQLGTVLDSRYKIVDYVAKGGMGAIYKAVDLTISGVWAVKEMLDYFDNENEREYAIARFATEAQILYNLDHESIPKFLDCFISENRYYLVMEFIEGIDLRRQLEEALEENRDGIEEWDVVNWGIQLCDVLHYLHSQDPPIIYRDLKPGNIIISSENKVYLVDFGIARIFDPRTKGTMVGTQGYAPPEQYRGKAEPRSDMYSLAACMHHLLTGKDPRNDIPFNYPPVRSIRPDLSEKIEAILQRALEMNPEDRFNDLADMQAVLMECIKVPPASSGKHPWEAAVTKGGEILPQSEVVVDSILQKLPRKHSSDEDWDKALAVAPKKAPKEKPDTRGRKHPPVKGKPQPAKGAHPPREKPEPAAPREVAIPAAAPTPAQEKLVPYTDGNRFSPWYMFRSDRRHSGCSQSEKSTRGHIRWTYYARSPIRSSPVIGKNGVLYFGADNGKLYAVSPTGKLLWTYATKARILSSPCLDENGNVYVGSNDCHLHAVKPNGSLLWKFRTYGRLRSSPCVEKDGTIFIGSYDHYLYAVRPNGKLKWRINLASYLEATPAIGGDGSIFAATRGTGSTSSHFYCLDRSGNIKWYTALQSPINSSPCISKDNCIFFGGMDGFLYTLNPDGSLMWKFKTEGPIASSPMVDAKNTVVVGSFDRGVYCIRQDGTLAWRFQTYSSVASSPALSGDNSIYVGSDDNHVYSLSHQGEVNWKLKCSGRVRSSPAVGADGGLFVGCDDGFLYALE